MHTPPRDNSQHSFLAPDLLDQLNPAHPLLTLSKAISWEYFEREFAPLYSPIGSPAKPIRLMVGLLMLKQLHNVSDEVLVQTWVQNPYHQAFCGALEFQWKFPCDPSELTRFRQRIGVSGVEKIFAMSIALHGDNARENEVCVDTTVQEKAITYPTDAMMYRKIIVSCWRIARTEGIALTRTYGKEVKQRRLELRFERHPKNRLKAKRARKRLNTIAGRLLRELQRKLSPERLAYDADRFALYERVLKQKRYDKNKIYSLHEPHVYCMSKGKPHKRYEYGTKASIAVTRDSKIIVGALGFDSNQYDGHTLPAVVSQIKRVLNGHEPDVLLCDRGYRGKDRVNNTQVLRPQASVKAASEKMRALMRERFRKRAGIEAVIGHLKADHRLGRNFLKGFAGDQINLLMAAAAFNLRKWMRLIIFWLKMWLGGLAGVRFIGHANVVAA